MCEYESGHDLSYAGALKDARRTARILREVCDKEVRNRIWDVVVPVDLAWEDAELVLARLVRSVRLKVISVMTRSFDFAAAATGRTSLLLAAFGLIPLRSASASGTGQTGILKAGWRAPGIHASLPGGGALQGGRRAPVGRSVPAPSAQGAGPIARTRGHSNGRSGHG